jgi:hypothetical protein
MPWVRKGRQIYKKVDGLKHKQTAKSPARAKRALNLLHGVEHGWKPTRSRKLSH